MEDIAPGSILQRIYFKQRLKKLKPGRFLEIGCGKGYLSEMLLKAGWTGIGCDLGAEACELSNERNKTFVNKGQYKAIHADFLSMETTGSFDLILSMMVIEHLSPQNLTLYFTKCKRLLTPVGSIAVFVPSSMRHWGVEDEIAGHYKRYEFSDFEGIAKEFHLRIKELSGLTYPVSNLLLGLSNTLVKNSEGHKKDLSLQERTIQSGNRGVAFKTSFPPYLRLILNEYILYPFHLLQRIFKSNKNCMVIYCELQLT